LISPLRRSGFSQRSQSPTRGTLRIAETFTSRQGEGELTGTESLFIRTTGCNLRCWFCDTPYASWHPEGEVVSIDWLADRFLDSGLNHVVLTGGEPLLPAACEALCRLLQRLGAHLTIETAGTIDRPIACDLLSLSPKLASSVPDPHRHPKWHRLHQERRLPIPIMRRLIAAAKCHQLKFVVDRPDEFDEVEHIIEQLRVDADRVWIMPQGTTAEQLDGALGWLQPWCRQQGYRYCDRMQIRWYGNRRGT